MAYQSSREIWVFAPDMICFMRSGLVVPEMT